jgi:hypothetical protein
MKKKANKKKWLNDERSRSKLSTPTNSISFFDTSLKNFSSVPVIIKNIFLYDRLQLLKHSEENCKILRNSKLKKTIISLGNLTIRPSNLHQKVDNFDLDLSSFKKIINDNSIFYRNFISQFKFDFKLKCY